MSKKEKKDAVQEPMTEETAAAAEAEDGEEAAFDVEDYLKQYRELEAECAAAKEAKEAAESQLTAAKDAAADWEARMTRLQADFDNYRRRQRQESEAQVKQAAGGLVEQILPVLDNFERALAAMEDSPHKEGVDMIARQLMTVLQNAGLEEIAALGEVFDPNWHQAVTQVEVDEAEKGKVQMVLQKGYRFNGKLLRASMVQVGA